MLAFTFPPANPVDSSSDKPQNWRFRRQVGPPVWRQRVIPKPLLARLLVGLLLLPIAIMLTVALAALLSAMQDAAGANFLNRAALGMGIVWVLGLVALLLALAANSLADGSRTGGAPANGPLRDEFLSEGPLDGSSLSDRDEPAEGE